MEILSLTVGETFGLRAPVGRFGIEIELEGANLPDLLPEGVWMAKGDGSLREGVEYVSRPTNTPRDTVNALAEILRSSARIKIDPSYRCSTHIHYNFVEKTWREVIGTIIVWNIFEPLFLKQMPPGRDGSIFCMSAYDTGDLPIQFGRFCEELRRKFMYHGFASVCRAKYASQNLTRLNDLGTVEFRIFPPSLEGREVSKWCRWLTHLVELTAETPFTDFYQLVSKIEKNPIEFVRLVFNDMPVPEEQVGAYIDLGCRTAYELVRIFSKECKAKTRKRVSKSIDEE